MNVGGDNLEELRAALRADAGAVAEALLGPRNKAASTSSTWRWGGKGSLAVEVKGPNRGLWFTHEGGEGSDLLGLIRHVRNCRFPEARAWAENFTGIVVDENFDREQQRQHRPPPPPDPDEVAEAATEQADRIAFAQRIASAAGPLVGTLAERYLKQVRGIAEPASGWPASIRWHPGYRALVAIATTADGSVHAVQRVHLDESGEKVGAEELERCRLKGVKLTNGVTDGAVVRLPGDPVGPLLIAEGPETGLACYTSTGHETWIALGSVTRVKPPIGRRVVVISDDNPATKTPGKGQAAKALLKVLRLWRKAGIDVVVATPWATRRRDRSDMADVILQHGPAAVRERIEAALSPAGGTTKRVPVEEARRLVAEAVRAFFDRVDANSVARSAAAKPDDEPAPGRTWADYEREADSGVGSDPGSNRPPDIFAHGVRCDVGTGKSHITREEIARILVAMRARGDTRCIVLAVPMHALSDEQAQRFRDLPAVRAAGLRVEVWRGRGAPDPRHPDASSPDPAKRRDATMCQRLDAVHDAQAVGLVAQTACCKRRVTEPDGSKVTVKCRLFDACAYQAQAEREADLWICASDLLWHEKPSAFGEVAAVVVDEAAWRKGLIGAEGKHLTLALDALDQDVRIVAKSNLASGLSEARLRELRRLLLEALRGLPEGPLRRDLVSRSLLTADSAAEAIKLEWSRKVDLLHPGMSREERREAMAQMEGNKTVSRFAALWGGLRALLAPGGPEASGWVSVETENTKDGPVRVVQLKGRKEIAEGWQAPTLLLDALLPVELVRPFWPDFELIADVKAEMPHQHVRQVVDRSFAKSMLEPLDEEAATADPEEAQRRANRLHDMRAILIREARRYAPGRVLAVLQKRVREALSDLGSLPPNLELAHHNNVAGRDEWRDVAALIVVGRTQPSPAGIHRITEALTGQAAENLPDWYPRADAVREMADGSAIQAEADRHPDPLAELIRWQTCEGELVQIIGRARGVNRTAADPVDVLVLTDVPLPIPLAGTLDAVELTPGPADHMMAAGGVVLTNARHAASAYPFLWSNREAAKKAFQRGKLGTFPYRELYIGECPQLRRIAYKAAGQGKQAAVAGFDPVLCPDPETFLAERLGKLAWCKVEGSPPPEPGGPPKAGTSKRSTPESDPAPPVDVDENPYPDMGQPDDWEIPGWAAELEAERRGGEPKAAIDPAAGQPAQPAHLKKRGNAPSGEASQILVCDVPWLHPETAAFMASDGAVVVPRCPFCGEQHQHGGFGHRLAHCADPRGRGYVLVSRGGAGGAASPLGP